jgi:TM2 domain-containing membrane protein YozV
MSTEVSQLKYWREEEKNSTNSNSSANGMTDALSYHVFLGLSVLGGAFGLDHLYLRSPLTFLAKCVVNMLFFGVWWFYDAAQAIFNSDVVKVYGLGVPGLGPKGIAAGVLTSDTPSKKHMNFFLYALALIFGGSFGLDSFLVGEKQTGLIRLISLISIIGIPISFGQWAYKLFTFFFYTKTVTSRYKDFFGAPGESTEDQTSGFFTRIIMRILDTVRGPAEIILKPVTDTVQMGIKTVGETVTTGLQTVDNTVILGKAVVDKSSEIATQVTGAIDALSQAGSFLPATSLYSSVTPDSVKSAKSALQSGGAFVNGAKEALQSGGSSQGTQGAQGFQDLNASSYVLLGTLLIAACSGFIATFLRTSRSSNHVSQRDDSPPEPGVFRESHQKE